jgi:hypothetical protein
LLKLAKAKVELSLALSLKGREAPRICLAKVWSFKFCTGIDCGRHDSCIPQLDDL